MRKLPQAVNAAHLKAHQPVSGRELPHESAIKHVTGKAVYVDDIPEPPNLVHVACGLSTIPSGLVKRIDLNKVWSSEGVVDVITWEDVPGSNDVSPVYDGDKLLAEGRVEFVGQPIFAVAADSFVLAKKACQKAKIEYEETMPLLDSKMALENEEFVLPTRTFKRGDAVNSVACSKNWLEGEQLVRGQEHFLRLLRTYLSKMETRLI